MEIRSFCHGKTKKFEKRKFYGNRFTNSGKGNIIANENVSNTPITQANLNVAHGVNNMQTPPSASRWKLFETTNGADYSNFNLNSEFERSETGYLLVDLSVLSLSLKKCVACKHCGVEDCVVLLEDQSNRKGLACRLVLVFNSCKQEFSFYSSKKTDHGYESNIRIVYGLRCCTTHLSPLIK